MALKHREIPPTLHFREANPRLELEETPFYVNRELEAWKRGGQERQGGGEQFRDRGDERARGGGGSA
nr:hypothetical protein [uncultured bacterium]